MNSVTPEYIEATEFLECFVEKSDKFKKRFISLSSDMEKFVKELKWNDSVKINYLVLGYALVDYFEDVRRLKEFHHLKHINTVKIVAYTSYWLLQRKPIQVIDANKNCLYVNEQFVAYYILDFLSNDKENILSSEKKGLESFSETLFYCLKYRNLSANSLEMIIMSFLAGRIYQEDDEDLSDKLSRYNDFDD